MRSLTGSSVKIAVLTAVAALLISSAPAKADDAQIFTIVIKDHKFDPSEVHVPPGKPVILVVKNADDTVEEFVSSALKVQKIIPGGKQGTVKLRPLPVGSYAFSGKFHSDTANGSVIAD